MSNARTHSRPSSPFVREYPHFAYAATALACQMRSGRTAARFQSIPQFAAPTSNPAATGVTGNDPQPPRPLPVTPTLFAAALAATRTRSRHGAKKAGTIFPTPTQSQRPISRADTAPRMNAAMSQSFEVRQDLIGQCQSERSRSDALPATLFRGLA